MTSASSRVHSPGVRACTDAKSVDGRHRRRPCGVRPMGSEENRYLFSDLHGPRAAATQLGEIAIFVALLVSLCGARHARSHGQRHGPLDVRARAWLAGCLEWSSAGYFPPSYRARTFHARAGADEIHT